MVEHDLWKVPRYTVRYEVCDLVKLAFSRGSKEMRAKLLGLMERPKLVFRDEWRFNTSMSNREFRRDWHRRGMGPFHATEHKRKFVLTARPGPGPLVKGAKFLHKEEQKASIRAREAARRRRDANGPAEGPLPPGRSKARLTPVRVDPASRRGVSTPGLVAGRGFTAARKPDGGFEDCKVLMMTHGVPSACSFSGPVGGLRITDLYFTSPPPLHWKRYWYFYRTNGRWRASEHHPYGDEEPLITQWLMTRLTP